MPFATWHDYFSARPTNKAGNKNTRVYNEAWARNVPNATKLAMITNDKSIAVLAVDANNKIMIMHSFKT